MNISISNKITATLFALVCAVALSSTMAYAQEYDDFSDFDATFEELDSGLFEDFDSIEFDKDVDYVYLDDEEFGLSEDELLELDPNFFDDPTLFDDDAFIDDFDEDFGPLDDGFVDGDFEFDDNFEDNFFDEYESFDAPEWDDVRTLVEQETDDDIYWDAVLPNIETGDVHIRGLESKAIFGIFDVDMTVSRTFDAGGVLHDVERPWYAIFAW